MSRPQTLKEERWNVYTHGFGLAVFIILSFFMIPKAIADGRPNSLIAIGVYCFSQVFLYTASTWYHHVPMGRLKRRLRKMDHISIYISIAGTYTPICLLSLNGSNGHLILMISWGIMAFGTIWKLFLTGKYDVFSSLLYLVMGWLIVIDLPALRDVFTDAQMYALIAGGLFFTVGIVFYAWSKLYFNHVIWHLFVLGGSFSHAVMVWLVLK
ncbi:PAQR family membrane homeostasis protein TrhA [Nonlabens ponticola]|uniref:Hemolysin III family protein n=1 Tax=Nonlabens ponticola TaxID=2496866 RepID=A0A3S9N079_9FLAO|nr:hemolysin III family protein [Nonlabens ponticola]AZQ44774.1 hemolysin III family protein [Nonlabens ponticola]